MNSTLVVRFVEAGVLAATLLLAAGLALWPRRQWLRRADATTSALAMWSYVLLSALLFPLLALGIGWLALWLPHGLGSAWANQWPAIHRSAWGIFWLIMLAYVLGEAAVARVAVATGRVQMPALLRGVLRMAVAALAAFFVLRVELGWNITPLLASTALVTAVVGFALQGVLGNLLAGISLNLTGALAHRDWVRIDDVEGQIADMNWRETWLMTREQIPVRIPNSKVADAQIRNLSRPVGPRRCSVAVDASYDDPPDRVIRALLSSAAAVKDVRQTPVPVAMLMEYKSYGIGYELRIWVDQYAFRESIRAEVRRHIWYQFRRASIQIPYPVTDQVLNDFMQCAVMPPLPTAEQPAPPRPGAALLRSDFATKVLADSDGHLLIPEHELAEWADQLTTEMYAQGETLFRQDEPGECCFVVLSGKLAGHIHHRGSGQTMAFDVGPGAVAGEMSLMTGLPRMADLVVAESAELLRIPSAKFAELLGTYPGLAEPLSRLVAERAQQNLHQIEGLLAADAERVKLAISSAGILRRFWRLLGGH
ncbi:MAG: mechanosensitive ion channel family protein [Kiritimatiellia bacterium]|jgi:small-conductance mechanosensitive channel/CRP-like cAMP-binding protein|nr:mechanosensitive ion channel family protein [Kiritimatiellia bacterium]